MTLRSLLRALVDGPGTDSIGALDGIDAAREMFPRCIWCGATLQDQERVVLVRCAGHYRLRHESACTTERRPA